MLRGPTHPEPIGVVQETLSFGGRDRTLPLIVTYTYILLFHPLQSRSRAPSTQDGMLPLPIFSYPTASVTGFIPDYYPRPSLD